MRHFHVNSAIKLHFCILNPRIAKANFLSPRILRNGIIKTISYWLYDTQTKQL